MCGLFGIINKEKAPFDFASFCTLGIANDSRGGDSCGIFLDGQTEYGIGQKAKFSSFMWESKLLNEVSDVKIALGHDRKASVGGITLEKAHPILIKEDDKIQFVLIHNGTIYNYEDLAKKFIPNIKTVGLSDSQVLALILYHNGWDCLEHYHGGAAFVCVDYREDRENPKVFMYRGMSKNYSCSVTETEERPLYLGMYDNGDLVFSSIGTYIYAITQQCYELPGNEVIQVLDGKLYTERKIDRSKCTQLKVQSAYSSSDNAYYGSLNRGSAAIINSMYDDDYYDDYQSTREVINSDTKFEEKYHKNDYDGYCWIKHSLGENRYMGPNNQSYLHGMYNVTKWGRLAKLTESGPDMSKVWFFHGILMRNQDCFKLAQKFFKKTKMLLSAFLARYNLLLRYLSRDQIFFQDGFANRATDYYKYTTYTGEFQMLGHLTKNQYAQGRYIASSQSNYETATHLLVVDSTINTTKLWQDLLKIYTREKK